MQIAKAFLQSCMIILIKTYSPQISSFPSNQSFTWAVVIDLGLSNGKLSALSQHKLAKTPSDLDTPNNTV